MKSIKDLPISRIAVYICKMDGCKYHSQYTNNMIDHFITIHDTKLIHKQSTLNNDLDNQYKIEATI